MQSALHIHICQHTHTYSGLNVYCSMYYVEYYVPIIDLVVPRPYVSHFFQILIHLALRCHYPVQDTLPLYCLRHPATILYKIPFHYPIPYTPPLSCTIHSFTILYHTFLHYPVPDTSPLSCTRYPSTILNWTHPSHVIHKPNIQCTHSTHTMLLYRQYTLGHIKFVNYIRIYTCTGA